MTNFQRENRLQPTQPFDRLMLDCVIIESFYTCAVRLSLKGTISGRTMQMPACVNRSHIRLLRQVERDKFCLN